MGGNRDILVPKHPTPPAGTPIPRASSAVEEFEDESLTPIEGNDPSIQAAGRAKQAAASSRATNKMVKMLQEGQADLAAQVTAYAESDKADHDMMKGEISEIKTDVKDLRTDVKDLTGHMTDMRVDVGTILGKLEIITPAFDLEQRNKAHAKRVKLDTTEKIKTFAWHTFFKVVGAVFAAAGATYGGHMLYAWLH